MVSFVNYEYLFSVYSNSITNFAGYVGALCRAMPPSVEASKEYCWDNPLEHICKDRYISRINRAS